ncbi:hypothetical protein JCM6882_002879 [Rhodosporidiobolus microsporus]
MFRATRTLLASASRTKISTGITGIAVHPEPLPALIHNYQSTLSLLEKIPAGAVYRQSAESITKERLAAVQQLGGEGSEADIEAVEQKIGAGFIEEVIMQSEDELKLAGKAVEWKVWEELEEAPAPGQWEPFRITPSTTTADDLHPK